MKTITIKTDSAIKREIPFGHDHPNGQRRLFYRDRKIGNLQRGEIIVKGNETGQTQTH